MAQIHEDRPGGTDETRRVVTQEPQPVVTQEERRVVTRVETQVGERRRGGPFWLWPLIPLLLGALALGLSLRGGNDTRAAGNQTTAVPAAPAAQTNNGQAAANSGQTATSGDQAGTNGGQAAAGNALTDMLVVVNEPNKASLAGRPATFTNVRVQSVVADKGFWVGPNKDQQVFVIFDEKTAGGPAEGQVQVKEGQNVTLTGAMEQVPGDAQARFGLDAASAAALAKQGVLLHAKQVVNAQ